MTITAADVARGINVWALDDRDSVRADVVRELILAEREACARYAESLADEQDDETQACFVALKIAAHIRARGRPLLSQDDVPRNAR